jgi:ADP-ribosyl-[dinitrogen reductase] hydrolase
LKGPKLDIVTQKNRYRGALLGLACGDALGTTVEFRQRGSFAQLTTITGGGPFGLEPGQWTDDTSMALCLAESLIENRGFDACDQMEKYLKWFRHGYLSATGECFDIGGTTRRALNRFEHDGEPFAGSTLPSEAGNGSLMRLAPAVLFAHPNLTEVLEYAALSSRTTHAAKEAVDCCRVLAFAMSNALNGVDKAQLVSGAESVVQEPEVQRIASRITPR